jgi:hypothetical protein
MGDVKRRRLGELLHRHWYEKGTDNKLTKVLRITNGKKSWIWAVRDGNDYHEVPSDKTELR